MILVWSSIDWRFLFRYLVPALIGIPVGLYLPDNLNATFFSLMVASFLIAYFPDAGFRIDVDSA